MENPQLQVGTQGQEPRAVPLNLCFHPKVTWKRSEVVWTVPAVEVTAAAGQILPGMLQKRLSPLHPLPQLPLPISPRAKRKALRLTCLR